MKQKIKPAGETGNQRNTMEIINKYDRNLPVINLKRLRTVQITVMMGLRESQTGKRIPDRIRFNFFVIVKYQPLNRLRESKKYSQLKSKRSIS